MRAVTYCRVSTSHQAANGTSLDTQREQTRALIQSRGWRIVGEFVDDGVSGAAERRPGLDALWVECRTDNVDVVVVAKLDRYGRSIRQLVNAFDELDRLGVTFVSVSEAFDSSTPTGRLMRNQLSSFAEFERDRITERMIEGLVSTARDGFWPGGPPPFGYRIIDDPSGSKHKVLEIWPERAEVLRTAASLVLDEGLSVYKATHLLPRYPPRHLQLIP